MLATHNIQATFCAGYEAATIHAASKGHLSVLKKHLGKRVKLLQYQWPMSHILHAVRVTMERAECLKILVAKGLLSGGQI